jgi:hypothetical protein
VSFDKNKHAATTGENAGDGEKKFKPRENDFQTGPIGQNTFETLNSFQG